MSFMPTDPLTSEGWFYALCYVLLLMSGIKLSVDGLIALFS